MRKSMIAILVLACAFAVIVQGCELLGDKVKVPGETKTEPSNDSTTESKPAEEAPDAKPVEEPAAPAALVEITNFKDGATGIDPKLPLTWKIDDSVGKVKMMGVNIFECGADGKEMPSAVIAFKQLTNAELCAVRSWTLFEKDVDANWLFQGSHADLKQLKSGTKYLMTFMIVGDKTQTIRIYFTTK